MLKILAVLGGCFSLTLLSSAQAADTSSVSVPPKQVCDWPSTISLNVTVTQAGVIQAWAQGADYSHTIWLGIGPQIAPQISNLMKKYCKEEK